MGFKVHLGKIYRVTKDKFYCKDFQDQQIKLVKARGYLLKGDNNIVVGDVVRLETIEREVYIAGVEPRKNEISRILIRQNKKKIMSANCDRLIIVSAASRPRYKRGLLDRYLVRSAQWKIPSFHVFNKMDEHDPKFFDIIFEADRLKELGVMSFEISSQVQNYQKKYLKQGMEELKILMKNQTCLVLGHSGVGKSHMISRLSDGRVHLKTKKIARSQKGAHGTSWSEIVDCAYFSLIDTPGIRSFSLDDILAKDLISYFGDLQEYISLCKYKNCPHGLEDRECYFQKKIDQKSREGALLHSRFTSYLKIYGEISEKPSWIKKY